MKPGFPPRIGSPPRQHRKIIQELNIILVYLSKSTSFYVEPARTIYLDKTFLTESFDSIDQLEVHNPNSDLLEWNPSIEYGTYVSARKHAHRFNLSK